MGDDFANMLNREVAGRQGRERIVAAAIQMEVLPGFVPEGDYPTMLTISAPPPARHHSLLHPFIMRTSVREVSRHQGFLTSTGRYVDRKQGYRIALNAGQFDPDNRKSGSASSDLFSEDLW